MLQSSIPPKFPIPWGSSAGSEYIRSIPENSQIGIQNGAASLTDGFPALTFVPDIAGGVPPFGQDWNGILKQITQWSQWQAAGGPIFYDSAFAAPIGGYPNGAMLSSAVVPRGVSAAADYAANKAIAVPNMKGLGLMGVDTMGGAASTFLSGVPITSGSDTAPGSIVGENLHDLVVAEIPSHTHNYSGTTNTVDPTINGGAERAVAVGLGSLPQSLLNGTGFEFEAYGPEVYNAVDGISHTYSGATDGGTGGNGSHNTVERNMLVYWNLKL